MRLSDVALCFDLMGPEPPVFADDPGPEAFASDLCSRTDEDRDTALRRDAGSIGHADVRVDHLLVAAVELADGIRRKKGIALKEQHAEIENADSDKRREAPSAITRTARIEDVLSKNIPRTLPQQKIKGQAFSGDL
jgi:hypothetical protein